MILDKPIRQRSIAVIGFIQFQEIDTDSYFISGVAVKPEYRKQGVASALVKHVLKMLRSSSTNFRISCTVSPSNIASISTFLKCGFVASKYIPNFYGQGKDRLFFEYGLRYKLVPTGHSLLIPVASNENTKSLIESIDYYITKIVSVLGERYFVVDQLEGAAEYKSDEVSVSVSFTGILLSSVTFLLGLIVATNSNRFPPDVFIYLLGIFVFLTVSLIVYTNAIGVISRLKNADFERYAAFGNITSEFGGFYPLIQIIPIIVATQLHNFLLGIFASLLSAGALALYQLFGFSILGRYIQNRFKSLLPFSYLAASPLIGNFIFYQYHTYE